MATDLIYNAVTLRNVLTLDFDQRPVRDASNTDIWWWAITLRVRAVGHAASFIDSQADIGAFGGGASPSNVAQVMAILRKRLGDDRGHLIYKMGGTTILDVDASRDSNNGPKVTELKFHHLSPKTVMIDFAVELAYYECATENMPDVISNRWSCSDDIDEQFVTTRNWSGVLRLRRSPFKIHAFRGLVVPVLNRGFKRERMHFTSEPNGLELGYSITDREMLGEAPPSPAYKMSCTHTEAIGQAASNPIGDLHVRLDGAKDSDKRLMIDRCMQIAVNKLQINENSKRKFIVQHIAIIDHIGENVNAVEVNVRVKHLDIDNFSQSRIGAVVMAKMGQPLELPEYDNAVAGLKGPFGTATAAGLFGVYLQHPCGNHAMPQVLDEPIDDEEESERSETGRTEVIYSPGNREDVLEHEPSLSDEHKDAIYEHYQVDSKMLRHENRVQLPIAKPFSLLGQLSGAPTAAVVTLAQPTCKRIIRISGERAGKWPVLISPVDFVDHNGIVHSLLEYTPTFRNKELSADGFTYTHALGAEYLYAMSRCPTLAEDIPTSSLPWDKSTAEENRFLAQDYQSPISEKGIA